MTGDVGVGLLVPVPQNVPCLEMPSPSLHVKKRVAWLLQHIPNARSAPQMRNQSPNLPLHMSKLNLTTTSKMNQSLRTHISVVLQRQAQKPRRSPMPKETLRCATHSTHPITLSVQSKRLQRRHLPLHHRSNTKNPQVNCTNPPQHLSSLHLRAVKPLKNA